MPHADFVHLRAHSAYSLSAGAIKVKELVGLCKKHGMPALALTDTGNLFGALEFAQAASEAGIQPIIGCELGLRRESDGRAIRIGPAPPPDSVVLLAQNERGYRNLLKLVSKSFLETAGGEPPQLDIAALEGSSDGLLLLTGGPAGPLGRLLLEGQGPAAEALLARLALLFPGRLYVELMRHGLPAEDRIEAALIDLAYARDLPLVATNGVFFATAEFYEAHDVLLCIAEGTVVGEPNRRRLTQQHHFKAPAAMRLLFADVPEAIDNTLVIARRCAYMPEPRKPILPPFPTPSGRDEKEELRAMAWEGLDLRLRTQVFRPGMSESERDEAAQPYRERLDFELDVIVKMGFAGYFLIVAEFIQWSKAEGIPVGPGRGSGAGSVVAWSLTITDLDPLRFGLLFERFLNPERVSMPDFDIDFCQDQRDSDETVARLLTIALKLEGLYRHASTHAAGVVIGDRPLAELVPLYRDPRSDMPATQFNMKWVELAGLVKFDFLGLKTLTVLARCSDLLAARGITLDLASLPLDDRASFELLSRGDTVGVFQVEGAGVRDMLKKLRPDRFEDIIAVVSLYRPGPMENIPRYIAVKHGEEAPDYLHPALEEILKETHGIMIYQEQVMQIAQVLAGYTLGGADLLRRAMGKKIQSEMNAQRQLFIEGAAGRGVGRARAELIFDQMAKFAGYGFNKSHAAAYALVAYQTAYLKANHPVEFMAASMTLDLGNTDKLNHFRQELGRLGVALLPPDINRSDVTFSVETASKTGQPAIRYALAAVKGVGLQAMRDLVAERD